MEVKVVKMGVNEIPPKSLPTTHPVCEKKL